MQKYSSNDDKYLNNNIKILCTIAKLENIEKLAETVNAPESATALVGNMKIFIPLEGLIDKQQEALRLKKEIEKLVKLESQFANKLDNSNFVNGAPEEVVNKEKEKLSSVQSAIMDLSIQLKRISSL